MSSRIRIADLTLDTGRRTVVRGTKPVALGPLTYKLLLALVEAAPEVASHDVLADSVWRGRAVSPATISQRIKLLRDALSDDASNPRYIQVLHGQGYRLIPPVKALPGGIRNRHRNMAMAGVAVGLAIVATFAVYSWFDRTPEPASHTTTSIAVLPFVDMSPHHDQEYLADGIAEEILNVLAETTRLRVTARTSSFSFKGQSADIDTIREVLNVDYFLEGSVRKSENRVRISADLVDTETGTRIWSDTYDWQLGDVLALQLQIANSVAGALKVKLIGSNARRHAAVDTINPQAFDSYLRGLEQLRFNSHTSMISAGQFFEEAIARDPEFIQAYYNLGRSYNNEIISALRPPQEPLAKLREVVDAGLKLAPDHAGMIALSGKLARYDGDLNLAAERLQRAMALNPTDSTIRMMYGGVRLDQSYPEESLEAALRTIENDPLNGGPYVTVAFSHIDLGNAEEALVAAARLTRVMPPEHTFGRGIAGLVKVHLQGDFVSGIQYWESASKDKTWTHEHSNMLATAWYSVGDLRKGNLAHERARQKAPGSTFTRAVQAYRAVIDGDIARAREIALDAVINPDQFTRWWGGIIALRLATDALIEQGEASRAVESMLDLAPEWASYMAQTNIPAEEFSPAPYRVKSSYSSYPALYFPDLVRALRASGDRTAAENMLGHLEAILEWRSDRGLLVEEVHVAEALALRDRPEAALDALERAEQDGTIYNFWQIRLLHNGIFGSIRNHPRFRALVNRVQAEMNRQRAELRADVSFQEPTGM